MITKGERINAAPILISESNEPKKLKRIPITEKMFQENWLQELIKDHPDLLPVSDIEPAFGPLIDIGREVPIKAGFIDNLFISSQGYITIVETKLWRNPEARREVVGQIIDYAKEISSWTYDQLNTSVKKYYHDYYGNEIGIMEALRRLDNIEEDQESSIIDAITRNLQRGRVLLLIVGDGIRESVEEMIEFLSITPQLHFTLALVELQVFEFDANKLVIPQLVMRTRELTRAVIRVEGGQIQHLSVDLDPQQKQSPSIKPSRTLTAEAFFEQLMQNAGKEELDFAKKLMEDAVSLGCIIEWRKSSFVIKFPDPVGSGQRLTMLLITKEGDIYIGWLPDQLQRLGLSKTIGEEYFSKMNEALTGCESVAGKSDLWSIKKANSRYPRLIQVVKDTIEAIKIATDN